MTCQLPSTSWKAIARPMTGSEVIAHYKALESRRRARDRELALRSVNTEKARHLATCTSVMGYSGMAKYFCYRFHTLLTVPVVGVSTPVIDAAARAFALPRSVLCGDSRERTYVRRRHAMIDVMARRTSLSISAIGRAVGGRDHQTIIHALRRVRDNPDVFGPLIAMIEGEVERKS
jgi:hypothetical protein